MVFSGWNDQKARCSGVITYSPDFGATTGVADAGQIAPAFTHAARSCNFLILQLAAHGHLELRIGLADGLNQQAFVGIARNDCRAGLSALQDAFAAVQRAVRQVADAAWQVKQLLARTGRIRVSKKSALSGAVVAANATVMHAIIPPAVRLGIFT